MAECPGIYKLSKMKDGLLARIRVPGGILSSSQIRALSFAAQTYGNGIIDLTNRANIQLRGIKEGATEELLATLFDENLISQSPEHDRLRNITMDPLAGLCDELIDCTPLVKQLDDEITKLEQPELYSPKMAFVFDGGGQTNISSVPHDFAFVARRDGETDNQLMFQVSLAGYLTSLYLKPAGLIDEILNILERLKPYNSFSNQCDIAEDQSKNIRIKNLKTELGEKKLLKIIAPEMKAEFLEKNKKLKLQQPANLSEQKDKTKTAINLISPTGRLTFFQAEGLAELVDIYGAGELRLTTWQGILLPNIDEEHIADVWEKAEAMALLTQQNEQNLQIISCSGSKGCIYGGFETKLTALKLREELSELGFPAPVTIHLSACEKGCATRDKTNYLVQQKRGSEELSLHINAAPNTEKTGKIIEKDNLISELKKLI